MSLSATEENYLKSIYTLSAFSNEAVSTNAVAERLQNSAASVTDMIKRLAAKGLVEHIPYRGVKLRREGRLKALFLLRKHRLWECFLHDKLNFPWDELHDIAEQLEHIQSPSLVDRLDEFLGYPKFDPHGEPIPDGDGRTSEQDTIALNQAPNNKSLIVKSVVDEVELLKYLTELDIGISSEFRIDKKIPFDNSILIQKSDGRKLNISHKAAERIFIQIK